jgi:hypothetical protein
MWFARRKAERFATYEEARKAFEETQPPVRTPRRGA